MSKVVKRMMIDQIREQIGETKDLVVLDTSRMDAISDNQLRAELVAKGIRLVTVKNTLARLALKEAGIEPPEEAFAGPSTIALGSEDIVALSREMAQWAKKIDELEIKGGAVDGQGVDSSGIEAISKGPSRDELISQIVGLVLSPGARLSGALLGPGGYLCGQIKALADKEGDDTQASGDAA